jgi:hypothetical protein
VEPEVLADESPPGEAPIGRVWVAATLAFFLASSLALAGHVLGVPPNGSSFGWAAAFLLGGLFCGCCYHDTFSRRSKTPTPKDKALKARNNIHVLIQKIIRILFIAAFVSTGIMLALSRLDGVASSHGPILAPHEEYLLNSHGTRTRVSRARYIVVGIAFDVAEYAGANIIVLVLFHYRAYGSVPLPGSDTEAPARKDAVAH